MTELDIERNNFEVTCLKVLGIPQAMLEKDERGNYLHSGINSTWQGWQQGAKQNPMEAK